MASCQVCPRTDLSLTQNGRLRSHAANGKRASADNPHCPGGSDWPLEHVRARAAQGDDDSRAALIERGEDPSGDGSVDNRPTVEEVEAAKRATASSSCPDDIFEQAADILHMAETYGVRGSTHVHRFGYGDDDRGHAGDFCACGQPAPADPASAAAAGAGVHTLAPGDRNHDGPNPHRKPLPTAQPGSPAQAAYDRLELSGKALRRNGVATTGDGSWQGTTQPPSSPAGTTPGPTSVPSSKPGTPASAGSAGSRSKRATSSGAPTGTSSTPSAQRSGSVTTEVKTINEATSFLSAPAPAGGGPVMAGSNDVPRDRWGRYLLPHPKKQGAASTTQPWTRATTMASSIADTFTLSQWSQRMAVKGITMRPDLYALASGYDVAADRDDMNSVCEQAKSAAGDKVAANLGTAMHTFTAAVDRGMAVNIPPTMVDDVNAYSAALRAYGFELVPDMIERRVALTRETAGEDIAGTFDRVYRATRDVDIKLASGEKVRIKAGTYLIGDLKTGRDLAYGWGEIAIQEAIYAHAVNENGVWDTDAQVWVPNPLQGAGVSEKIGIVVHLPIQKKEGAPACVLYAVDLEQGWEAIQLCVQVRKWRKAKKIATPLDVVDQAPRPAAVSAPIVDDDAAEVANRRSAGELADPRKAAMEREAASSLAQQALGGSAGGDDNGRAPAYRRPTAVQMADHPSVARKAAVEKPPAARPPTWEERADAVTTKAEASAIYNEMRPQVQTIGQNRFNAIVKRMQVRLNSLVEQGG